MSLFHLRFTLKAYFKIIDDQQFGGYFDSIVIFHLIITGGLETTLVYSTKKNEKMTKTVKPDL